jgi:uncharacterized membrane protein
VTVPAPLSPRRAGYLHIMPWVRGRCLTLILATLVSAACYWADWQSPVRVAITVAFLLFLPGLALAELARVADGLERLVVGIGASLALETLVAVAFLYGGAFTPGRVFAAVAASTGAIAAVAAFRDPRTT